MKFLLFITASALIGSLWVLQQKNDESSELQTKTKQQSSQIKDLEAKYSAATIQGNKLLYELTALQKEFEEFKVFRRQSMIGRNFPVLEYADGKTINNAEIKEVNDDIIVFLHDGGVAKLAYEDLSEELKWEAVWQKKELHPVRTPKILGD